MHSAKITKIALKLMNFVPLCLTLGQTLIIIYLKVFLKLSLFLTDEIPLLISIILSILIIFIPWVKVNKSLFSFKSTSKTDISYDEA